MKKKEKKKKKRNTISPLIAVSQQIVSSIPYTKYSDTLTPSQQAKNIGPTLALNGYLYGSYMGNP